MKPLLSLLLILPMRSWAVDCDGRGGTDGGIGKTVEACRDPNSAPCRQRLPAMIQACQKRLEENQGKDGAHEQQVVQDITGWLSKFQQIQSQQSSTPPEKTAPNPNDQTQNDQTQASLQDTNAQNPGTGALSSANPGRTGGTNGATPPTADALAQGKQALVKGRPAEALKAANSVLATEPQNLDALQLKAQAQVAQNDMPAATTTAGEMLKIDQNNAFAHLMLDARKDLNAGALSRIKNFDLASNGGFNAAAQKTFGNANGTRGFIGQTQTAVAPTQIAGGGVQLRTNAQMQAASLVQSALSKLRLRDMSGAMVDADRAVASDPRNVEALATRARIWNSSGKPAKALEDAKAALAVDERNVAALLESAYAKYQLATGRDGYLDALGDAEKALALDPLNAMGHLYRGMIKEKLQDAAEAVKEYRRAVDLDAALKPLACAALETLGGAEGLGCEAAGGARAPSAPHRHPPSFFLLFGGILTAALGLIFKGARRHLHALAHQTPHTPQTPRTPHHPVG